MIRKLAIRNFAIIQESEIYFPEGLTVITGETGAGKSILLGALNLLSGSRADTGLLFDSAEKALIEGYFKPDLPGVIDYLKSEDLELFGDELIIRRELLPNGKSRAFINDQLVSLQQLKVLGNLLFDISYQNDALELSTRQFQYTFIDAMANSLDLTSEYARAYQAWKKNIDALEKLENQLSSSERETEFLNYLWNELAAAEFTGEDELNELEQEFNVLTNANAIQSALTQLHYQLSESDFPIELQLGQLLSSLHPFRGIDNRITEIIERLNALKEETKDLANESIRLSEAFYSDEERINQLEVRINLINKLLKKHQASDLRTLLMRQEEIAEKLKISSNSSEELEVLRKTITEQRVLLEKLATQIHENRTNSIEVIENSIRELLPSIGLPHARFKIDLQKAIDLGQAPQVKNQLKFLFSANQGSEMQELHKVASGGELSRLMLAIKSLLHDRVELPTAIFDEIDTGISGETSLKIGNVLSKMAEKHQIILITHQPQIAAKGNNHLYVSKSVHESKTVSKIKVLQFEERILELAKMLGGEKASETAILHARTLLTT